MVGRRPRYSVAIFLVSASTLALQVALVRVLSIALWYHFAFLVVSTAVLGFGLSGMAIAMRPTWLTKGVERRVIGTSVTYAASIIAAYLVLNAVPFEPFRLSDEPIQLLYGALYVALLTGVFFGAGLTVGLILTSRADEIGRLYAWDLAGAGIGCLLVTALLSWTSASGAVFLAAFCAAAAAATLIFASGRSSDARMRIGVVALLIATGLLAMFHDVIARPRIAADKEAAPGVPMSSLFEDSERHRGTYWNAMSRLDVVDRGNGLAILIDGGVAMTRVPPIAGPIDEIPPLRDFTSVAFALVNPESVFVIGSGGGWEVAGALTHGATHVTGVEVNPTINTLMRNELSVEVGGLFSDSRVHIVTDEARSYLRRTERKWDTIVGAHTLTHAAFATGSTNLAEAYTVTMEAMRDYLDHLEDDGALYLTRPEVQLPRLFRTAIAELRRRNLDPAARLLAIRIPQSGAELSFSAGLLVTLSPLASEITSTVQHHDAEVLYAPERNESSIYSRLLRQDILFEMPYGDLRPVPDDRPFFNQRRSFSSIGWQDMRRVFAQGNQGRTALEEQPVAEVSLVILLIQSVTLSAVFTLLPVVWRRRRNESLPVRTHAPLVAYFVVLGLGFMCIELGLVQRLALFIGPPTLTFTTVVGALLVFSGLGSWLSNRVVGKGLLPLATGGCAAVLTIWLVVAPSAMNALLGLPLVARLGLAVLLVAPVGIAAGMPFPLGMRVANADGSATKLLPLLWGVNGFASVVASVGSLIVAATGGFTAVLVCAALLYTLAALLLRWEVSKHSE